MRVREGKARMENPRSICFGLDYCFDMIPICALLDFFIAVNIEAFANFSFLLPLHTCVTHISTFSFFGARYISWFEDLVWSFCARIISSRQLFFIV